MVVRYIGEVNPPLGQGVQEVMSAPKRAVHAKIFRLKIPRIPEFNNHFQQNNVFGLE
jgi:hypothetical protein